MGDTIIQPPTTPSRIRPSSVGMRLMAGRVFNASFSTETTYERVFALSAKNITAIQVIFAAGQTSGANAASPSMNAQVRAIPNLTDAAAQAAINKQVTVGGATSWTFTPAASNARRNFIVSDWITCPSVARDDGGSLPLYVIRAHIAAGQIVISGNGTDQFGAWETQPNGLISRMRHFSYAADYSGSGLWASWASAAGNVSSGSPIVGIRYIADGKVINVFGFGDSITEGRGTRIGEGFGVPACVTASQNAAGIPYEWSNMGWSGQTMAQILQQVQDAITAGLLPDIAVIPSGSPNNVGNTSITDAMIDGAAGGVTHSIKGDRAQILAALAGASRPIEPIIWTWLPTNTATNNYGTSDSKRRADNDRVRAMAAAGCVIADFDAKLAGSLSNGQVQMASGSTDDGIHPNDTGNAALSPSLVSAMQRIVGTLQSGRLY